MCNLPTIFSPLALRFLIKVVLLSVVLAAAPQSHASTVFPIANNSVVEAGLGFAFDGTNYLTGIQGGPLAHDEVAAQLFSGTGALVGSRVSTGRFGGFPYVAFDGSRYLMIWQDLSNGVRNIYGQFISRSGALSGGSFRVGNPTGTQDLDAMRPIAFGTNRYLVVYRDSRTGTNGVYGQLITAAGLLSGSEIAIDNSAAPAQEASVAFGAGNFLVVWQKRTSPSHYDTYGVFITPGGSKGVPFLISQSASASHNPLNVLFNGTNYLVTWNKDVGAGSASSDFDIYGRLVAPGGALSGSEVALVSDLHDQVLPGVAFDGTKYLLSWTDGPFGSTTNILTFQFFNSTLQRIGGEFFPFAAKGTNYPFATASLYDGRRYVAIATLANVGTNFNFYSADIYGTFLSKIAVSILVNGISRSGDVIVTNQASVDITSTLTNGVIFYTLNGEYPGTGPFYYGTLTLTQSTTIRAIAYSADYSDFGEAADVNLVFAYTPRVTVQPTSEDRLVGQTAIFAAQATGTPPLTYQWSFNGSAIPAAVNPSLVIPNVQLPNAGQYAVSVNNTFGTISSTPVALNVYDLPSVLTQPVGTNVFTNDLVQLKVVASGFPAPHYQWRLNGVNLPGQTNATLTITNVQLVDGGNYTVVVANDLGTVISDPASVALRVPSLQAGDFFTNRVLISGMSGIVSGTSSFATREPGEPNPAQKPGGKSVWYRWVAPSNGIATFSTRGSTFDTLLGSYRGSLVSNLTVQASDEDSGGGLTSEIRFSVTNGVEYEIAIDGYGGAGGYFVLTWGLEVTTQTVPTITQQPRSVAVLPGNNALFSVTAGGSGLFYHWFFNDAPISGAAGASLTVTNAQLKDIGSYSVQVSNSFGRKITSSRANLELVSQPASPTADKLADVEASAATNQFFGPSKGPPGFTSVGFGNVGYQFFGNIHSGTDPIDSAHCAIGGASSWLKFVPQIDATMSIDTITSQVYTVIAVYRGGEPRDIVPTNIETCDVDHAPDGHSLVNFHARQGQLYSVLVDGINGATGLIFLHYCLGSAATVGTEFATPPIPESGELFLAPSILGGMPQPSYQWYRDDQLISQANEQTYLVEHAQAGDAGVYSLVVSNCLGFSSNVVTRITVEIPLLLGYTNSQFNGRFQFAVTGLLSHAVTLQGTTNLLNWIPLLTNKLPGSLNYLDPLSPTLPWRSYRAIPWP